MSDTPKDLVMEACPQSNTVDVARPCKNMPDATPNMESDPKKTIVLQSVSSVGCGVPIRRQDEELHNTVHSRVDAYYNIRLMGPFHKTDRLSVMHNHSRSTGIFC